MIVMLQGGHVHSKIESALERYNAPMLLVVAQDDFSALSSMEEYFIHHKKVDAIPESCSNYELNWRLELLRRRVVYMPAGGEFFNFGGFGFDLKRRQAWAGGKKIPLNPMEFELSLELFRNVNSLVSRERLYARIWGESLYSTKSRKLDVCVSSVRRKMNLHEENGFLLKSIYGRGYELNSLGL